MFSCKYPRHQGLAALWIPTSLKYWPQPMLNCIDIRMNTINTSALKGTPLFCSLNRTLTCCILHCFQASFRISPRRQLPATNTQIETHYLKSIALKDSFKKKKKKQPKGWGRKDNSKPSPANFQLVSPQRQYRSSMTAIAVVQTSKPPHTQRDPPSMMGLLVRPNPSEDECGE